MTVGDAMHRGDPIRRIEQLERQMRELGGARRGPNTSIGEGGIRLTGSRVTVTDELGAQELVRLGILDDGSQGLEIVDPDRGVPVALHTLAFGQRVDIKGSHGTLTQPTTGSQFQDLPSPAGVGPQVTVRVGGSGQMRVTIAARVTVEAYDPEVPIRSSAIMGFELVGPSGRPASQWPKLELHAANSAQIIATLARPYLVGGLTPGLYTATCKYMAGYNTIAEWGDRYIDIQPY